jgi:hypothetical protein
MGKFESFCRNIHKTKAGYVPDLIDLESDELRDLAMAAFIADKYGDDCASQYLAECDEMKNLAYSKQEFACQDAIDAYNQLIDDDRERAAKESDSEKYFDEHWAYSGCNVAMFDAGHKESDF